MNRIANAWRLAEHAVSSLTTPRLDPAAVDREVEAALRDSRLCGWTASAAAKFEAAWLDSRSRAAVRWLTDGLR